MKMSGTRSLSLTERIKTRIEHEVDTRSVRLAAGQIRLTKGRIARIEVGDRTLRVRAEELSADEAAAFWPCVLQAAPDYARYPRRTSRRLPMMRLVPIGPGEGTSP